VDKSPTHYHERRGTSELAPPSKALGRRGSGHQRGDRPVVGEVVDDLGPQEPRPNRGLFTVAGPDRLLEDIGRDLGCPVTDPR
jgi:hypothetical protein